MPLFRQGPWNRLGAAFGALAILVLALAAPIHHIHAIGRDLAKAIEAGHQTGPHAAHAAHVPHDAPDRPDTAPVHCPLCTLGKMAGLLLPPDLPSPHVPGQVADSPVSAETAAGVCSRCAGIARPRGPPARA